MASKKSTPTAVASWYAAAAAAAVAAPKAAVEGAKSAVAAPKPAVEATKPAVAAPKPAVEGAKVAKSRHGTTVFSRTHVDMSSSTSISLYALGVGVVKLLFQSHVYEAFDVLVLTFADATRARRDAARASLYEVQIESGRQLTLPGQTNTLSDLFLEQTTIAFGEVRTSDLEEDTSVVGVLLQLADAGAPILDETLDELLPDARKRWRSTRRQVAALTARLTEAQNEITTRLFDSLEAWYDNADRLATALYANFGDTAADDAPTLDSLKVMFYVHLHMVLRQTTALLDSRLSDTTSTAQWVVSARASMAMHYVTLGERLAKHIVARAVSSTQLYIESSAPATTASQHNARDYDDSSTSSQDSLTSSSESSSDVPIMKSAPRARRVRRRTAVATAAIVSNSKAPAARKKAVF